MDILTIGGVTLPAPNEYKVQLNDLDSSDTGGLREDLTCGKTGKL